MIQDGNDMAELRRKRPRTEQYRQAQYERYRNPIPRKKTIKTLDESERKRLDNALLMTETPIVLLAKRFELSINALHDRLHELGFRAGKVAMGMQDRIPLNGAA